MESRKVFFAPSSRLFIATETARHTLAGASEGAVTDDLRGHRHVGVGEER